MGQKRGGLFKIGAVLLALMLALVGCAPAEISGGHGGTAPDGSSSVGFSASSSVPSQSDSGVSSSQSSSEPEDLVPYYFGSRKEYISAEDLGHYLWCPLRKGIDPQYDELIEQAKFLTRQLPEWEADGVLTQDVKTLLQPDARQVSDLYAYYQKDIDDTLTQDGTASFPYIELNLNNDAIPDYLMLWEGLCWNGGMGGNRGTKNTILLSSRTEAYHGFQMYNLFIGSSYEGTKREEQIDILEKTVNGVHCIRVSYQFNDGYAPVDNQKLEWFFFEEDWTHYYYYYYDPAAGDGGKYVHYWPEEGAQPPWA